jgi:hypothetical protein
MNPNVRAHAATICFALIGLGVIFFRPLDWTFALPQIIFYAVLTINTYFSIQFFTPLTPKSFYQLLVDAALVVAYISLGLSIGFPYAFAFCALLIFVVAPMKYTHKLDLIPHTTLLRKKILIDLCGALMCTVVLGLTIFGYPLFAAWLLAILFSAANVYLLLMNPMYRHI